MISQENIDFRHINLELLQLGCRINYKTLTDLDYLTMGDSMCQYYPDEFSGWWNPEKFNWLFTEKLLQYCGDDFDTWYDADIFFSLNGYQSIVQRNLTLLRHDCGPFEHVWYKDYLAYRIVCG
jgi:hypothetical protein